jgi:hypothetical protein
MTKLTSGTLCRAGAAVTRIPPMSACSQGSTSVTWGAVDFYAAALSVVAGSLADRELLGRHRERNRERGTGPHLAIQATSEYLRGWQDCGHLDRAADPSAIAIALCGGALLCAWTQELAGEDQVPGGRDGFIRALIAAAAGPYLTKGVTT